jgi:hypothetical protein
MKLLVQAVLVIVLVLFMLIKREDLRNRVIRLSGEGSITSMTKALDEAAQRISRFLLMQLVINGTFGLVISIGLFFLGVEYPLVWGFLAGALRYVPYIGVWVGAAFPLMLTALEPGTDWTPFILVLGLFLAAEMVTGNVVEPWLFGHSVGVSEVALLVAAAFWAWLWGPIGLVLSTPLTACLAVMGRYVPQMEFFDVLLGDAPVLKEFVLYFQRLLARDEDEADRLVEAYYQKHGDAVFDEVFLPAAILTSENHERGKITDDDQMFIYQATRELIDDVPAPGDDGDGGKRWHGVVVPVFGFPAQGEADELALLMLGQMVDAARWKWEVFSSKTLAAEMVQRVEQDRPGVVCIAALPPRGQLYARYLVKRLRGRFSGLKIVVLFPGPASDRERAVARLRQAGANEVTGSLAECRAKLLPLVQVLAAAEGPQQKAAAAASGNGKE